MNGKVRALINRYTGKKIGVFIDDANMFHSQKRAGWRIDWRRFKAFLDSFFDLGFVKYYRGIYPEAAPIKPEVREKHERFSFLLEKIGFSVIKRELKKIYLGRNSFIYKCDFDAEIGFDIARSLRRLDLVILVSGDSDFKFLATKLSRLKKGFIVFCFRKNSPWEFYRISHVFLEEIKDEVELKTPPCGGEEY